MCYVYKKKDKRERRVKVSCGGRSSQKENKFAVRFYINMQEPYSPTFASSLFKGGFHPPLRYLNDSNLPSFFLSNYLKVEIIIIMIMHHITIVTKIKKQLDLRVIL